MNRISLADKVIFCILAAFSLAAAVGIISGHHPGGLGTDSLNFHIPQIQHFSKNPFDFIHYPATAPNIPGYHILTGWISGITGMEASATGFPLRFLNASFNIILLYAVFRIGRAFSQKAAESASDGLVPLMVLLPYVLSRYSSQSALYYVTDYISCGMVAVFLWALGCRRKEDALLPLLGAAIIAIKHMWAPLLLMPVSLWAISRLLRKELAVSLKYSLWIAVPGIAVILLYVANWQGLTPPGEMRRLNRSGLHLHSWIHTLAFLGVCVPVFLPLRWNAFRAFISSGGGKWVLLSAAFSFALWIAVPSNYDHPSGRWGSIVWTIAQKLPCVGEHSIALLPLIIMGATFVSFWVYEAIKSPRLHVECLAYALLAGGLALTHAAHQRYIEPLTLLCLGLWMCRPTDRSLLPWSPFIPAAAGGLLFASSVIRLL